MTANEILNTIYNANANVTQTEYLYHSIGMQDYEEHLETIRRDGFQIESNPNDWTDIDELIPNRPGGTFFWGEDNKPPTWTLRVKVSDLDLGQLYAFPAAIAHTAWEVIRGAELVDGGIEALKQAYAVPFREYDGNFAAEFIFTGDISIDLIEWQFNG